VTISDYMLHYILYTQYTTGGFEKFTPNTGRLSVAVYTFVIILSFDLIRKTAPHPPIPGSAEKTASVGFSTAPDRHKREIRRCLDMYLTNSVYLLTYILPY